ncbi:MAG: DMT family transporter [Candidatus Eisenbacteria bacterium]
MVRFPRSRLVGAALLFSTGGAAIKAVSLTSWQVASMRSAIAALAIALLLPASRRAWSWRAALVALAYAATLILFVLANKLTTSANAIFLQSTAPLYILIASPWLLRERPSRDDVGFVLVVVGALALFFLGREPAVATATDPRLGNILALSSGVSWALTLMGLRWLAAGPNGGSAGSATIVIGNLLGCAIALPFALPVEHMGLRDLGLMLFLGVFQLGLAYVLVTAALRALPALEASAILLIEPTFNPVWSWLVHGERPNAWSLVGGALILGATLVKSWRDARTTRAAGSQAATRVQDHVFE